jgi:bacterioferritin (cytochrome b1)
MGNNNVINSNNIINIQLRPYTDPRLPDDMDDIFEESWDKMKSVQTYLERIHFSEELPENNNMCITNLQTKLAKVFNGKKW